MFLPAVILLISGYASGDPSSCGSLLPTSEMNALGEEGSLFPDRDQLSEICPSALQDTPEDFDPDTLLGYKSFDDSFGDLCSENSEMRISYLANIDCLKSVEPEWKTCLNASNENYAQYNADNEERPHSGEKYCFTRGYATGCMSQKIQEICGQEATTVYQLFMNKYRYVASECSSVAAEALRTRFLEYLKLSGGEKDIYERVFNTTL